MDPITGVSRGTPVVRVVRPLARPAASRALLLACALFLAAPGMAQTTGDGPVSGQALIVDSDGKLHCGITIRRQHKPGAGSQHITLVSASIRLDSLHGTVVSEFAASEFLPSGDVEQIMRSTRVMPVDSGWIRATGSGNASTAGSAPVPLHPIGGARHTVARTKGLPVLSAALAGEPIEVGVRLAGRAAPVTRVGVVLIGDADKRRVQSCLDVALAAPGK